MIKKDLTVKSEEGIHARPASMITNTCQKFTCDIKMEKDEKTIDAKSILGIMMLSAKKGDIITIITDGDDEVEALKAIETLFEKDFNN